MYINGYGYNQIIRTLNEKGYKTKKGKAFGKNSIHGILTNEKYTGVYIFNRVVAGKKNSRKSKSEDEIIRIEDAMPKIISREMFDKTKEMMMKRKHSPGSANTK